MLLEVIIILYFLKGFLNRKDKEKYKPFKARVVNFMLKFKYELSENELDWSLVDFFEGLLLFFPSISPVVFDLLVFLPFERGHLIFVILCYVGDDIREIFKQKLSQNLNVIYFG